MDRSSAATLARELMNRHGLGDIPFEFDNRRRAFGTTYFYVWPTILTRSCTVQKISLSEPLVELNDEATVRNTILHEIAHAKAGMAAGHGYAWKQIARSIGADPERECGEGVKVAAGKYQATCACKGYVHHMYRRPSKSYHCRDCKQRLVYLERGLASQSKRT